MLWPPGGGDGRTFDTLDIGGAEAQGWSRDARAVVTPEIVAQAVRMRQTLCFSVADAAAAAAAAAGDGDDDDGGVGDACISSDGNLSPALLLSSLRRSCCARTCVPGRRRAIGRTSPRPATHSPAVVVGAALRNTGVQPLLDAVVDFLPPPPSSTPSPPLAFSHPHSSPETLAFAFKTVFDVKMGQELTYVRVYSGMLAPKQALYVSTSSSSSSGGCGGGNSIATERISSIFRILADEVQPLQQVIPHFSSRPLATTSSLFPPAAACG